MAYIHTRPNSTSFTGKGLSGYTFGPLKQKDLEIYYVEVEKGHDVFMVSKKITRTYYVASGSGYFTIAGERYNVTAGMLVEVPPKVEYCYSGRMTLIALSRPRWFRGNDVFTKWNPDVMGNDSALKVDRRSWLARLAQWRLLGKSPANAWLQVNQRLWDRFPSGLTAVRPIRRYGDLLHKVARMRGDRAQAFATLFLRNRPELELIRRLVERKEQGAPLSVTVLGCSIGAEAYSIAWRIRSVRPDLRLTLHAVDISSKAVEFAERGEYTLTVSELSGTKLFEAVTAPEMEELFETNGDLVRIKPWIKEGIEWHVGDVGDEKTIHALGPQDIVVANNFLCHMEPPDAESCLRNIARLTTAYGYLFVSGIDLDVRTKVARELGWEPIQELLEEIHDGDIYLRRYWPSLYAGLEPLDRTRPDWKLRYAASFQVGGVAIPSPVLHQDQMGDEQIGTECIAGFSEYHPVAQSLQTQPHDHASD
jgi:chemotaxis methyl-accepting protein methylase/mannose-6-phosphate isomerase-like protein (cupin superfamily)